MNLKHDLEAGGRRLLIVLLLLSGDLVAFYLALGMAYLLRTRLLALWLPFPFTQNFPDLVFRFCIPMVVVGVFAYEGLYSNRALLWEEIRQIFRSLCFSFIVSRLRHCEPGKNDFGYFGSHDSRNGTPLSFSFP